MLINQYRRVHIKEVLDSYQRHTKLGGGAKNTTRGKDSLIQSIDLLANYNTRTYTSTFKQHFI